MAEVDRVRAALTEPMTEMLRVRFPSWASDEGGNRYEEFIDRVAGIAVEAGCVVACVEGSDGSTEG